MLRSEMSLRTITAGARLQNSSTATCAYHTTAPSRAHKAQRNTRPSIAKAPTHQFLSTPTTCKRYASASSASPAADHLGQTRSSPVLDWNTFFKLRKTRRRLQLGSSVGTSLMSMVGGAQLLARSDMDAIVGQIPLDPFITLGLITFSFGGVGWLLGPIVGTGVFNVTNNKYKGEMIVKEKGFYDRIRQHRVDPSASSMANPVPDYYGEKISSVAGYRQWLKDQRAFTKKRETFVR